MMKQKTCINRIDLEISNPCNERCVHCYRICKDTKKGYLSANQAKNVLEQAKLLGATSTTIAGGESFLHAVWDLRILKIFRGVCIFLEHFFYQVKTELCGICNSAGHLAKFFHLLAIKLRNRLLVIRAVHVFFLLPPVKSLVLKNTGIPLHLLLLMHFIHGILIRFLLILITLFVRLFCIQIFLTL